MTTTTQTPAAAFDRHLAAIRTVASEAADGFVGWDWSHDPAGYGIVTNGPGAVSDWDAWEAERKAHYAADGGLSQDQRDEGARPGRVAAAEREYGEKCQGDASAAADHGTACVAAAERGDWKDALDEAESAARLEADYGEAVVYRALVDACKAALEASEDRPTICIASNPREDLAMVSHATSEEEDFAGAYRAAAEAIGQAAGINIEIVTAESGDRTRTAIPNDDDEGTLEGEIWQMLRDCCYREEEADEDGERWFFRRQKVTAAAPIVRKLAMRCGLMPAPADCGHDHDHSDGSHCTASSAPTLRAGRAPGER